MWAPSSNRILLICRGWIRFSSKYSITRNGKYRIAFPACLARHKSETFIGAISPAIPPKTSQPQLHFVAAEVFVVQTLKPVAQILGCRIIRGPGRIEPGDGQDRL